MRADGATLRQRGFGPVSRLLHWSVAATVIAMLGFGFWLQTLPSGPGRSPYVQVHKSIGVLVLVLAGLRAAWRMRQGFPPPVGARRAWERRAARALQGFLLAATLLMPLTGVVRSLAYGRPVAVFGWPVIPQVFETRQDGLNALAGALHDGLALALTAALLIHAAAALKHHLWDRDATLRRMIGPNPERPR